MRRISEGLKTGSAIMEFHTILPWLTWHFTCKRSASSELGHFALKLTEDLKKIRTPPHQKKKKGRKTKNRKTWQSRSKTFQRDEQDTEVPMRLTCSKNQKETKGNNGSGVSRRRGLGQQKWLRNEFGTKGSGQIKWRLQILIRNVDFIIPSHYMRFVLVHSTAFSVPTSFHGIKFSNYLI